MKEIVCETIKHILNLMNDEHKVLAEKYILKSSEIPYWKDNNGVIRMG